MQLVLQTLSPAHLTRHLHHHHHCPTPTRAPAAGCESVPPRPFKGPPTGLQIGEIRTRKLFYKILFGCWIQNCKVTSQFNRRVESRAFLRNHPPQCPHSDCKTAVCEMSCIFCQCGKSSKNRMNQAPRPRVRNSESSVSVCVFVHLCMHTRRTSSAALAESAAHLNKASALRCTLVQTNPVCSPPLLLTIAPLRHPAPSPAFTQTPSHSL